MSGGEGKRPFDIDLAFDRLRQAVAPLPVAAMYQLADEGFGSPFEQLVACIISIRTRDETTLPAAARALSPRPHAGRGRRLAPEEIDQLIRPSHLPRGQGAADPRDRAPHRRRTRRRAALRRRRAALVRGRRSQVRQPGAGDRRCGAAPDRRSTSTSTASPTAGATSAPGTPEQTLTALEAGSRNVLDRDQPPARPLRQAHLHRAAPRTAPPARCWTCASNARSSRTAERNNPPRGNGLLSADLRRLGRETF